MAFKDHFSALAERYARYRPRYPEALFDWLAAQAPARALAWDCGTGNGQAALALASRFARVVATDPSAAQIAQAVPAANVDYRVEPAEAASLADASADLITVAQALHWFDLARFNAEAARVLKPGGVLAAWGYEGARGTPAVTPVVRRFYEQVIVGDWPPERAHVDNGYRDLALPFPELPAPVFELEAEWTLEALCGYLSSMSATRNYQRRTGADPLDEIRAELAAAWGDPAERRPIRWPLKLKWARKPA